MNKMTAGDLESFWLQVRWGNLACHCRGEAGEKSRKIELGLFDLLV